MLIVSKIERQGGSRITIGNTAYMFEPTGKSGKHMCEIKDEAHIKRLLSITEGFEPFDPEEAAEFLPDPDDFAVLQEGPRENEGEGEPDDADKAAHEEAEATLETTIEPDADDGLDEMDDITLAHAYEDEFDKKPAATMKRETMINRIRKARAEAEG